MSTTDASNSYAQADEYIQYKLQKARRRIKLADLLTAGLLAAVLLIGYVLVFTVLDHWVVSDGFSPWTRAIGLGLVLLLCAIIVVRYVVIPWFKTIHPLYAARVLDSSGNGLRGALVSLIDLKAGDENVSDSVRSVMENRAAVSLADVNVDDAIDQRWLMKLGIALFTLVVLTSIYAVASPKGINLLRPLSVANAAVATQTQILKVDPGTTTIAAGESLEVAVDLGGAIPEEVTLEFTTRDKTYVNEVLTLSATDSNSKFQTIIVGESERGLRQNFTYRVLAGDAVSEDFLVTVDQPPTANVLQMNYEYPSYMMMARQETADGNIAAWEGTKVQLVAEASVPIKRATLEFSDTATFDIPAEEVDLIVQDQQILGQFTLQLREDKSSPKFYRIAVQDFDGRTDPQPTVYAVNIRPDKAPVVKLLDPIRDLSVPANAIIPLLVQAEDPDFMLRNVKLEFDVNGEIRTPELLYDGTRTALVQKWTGRFEFRLEDLEVRPGDVINYRITARDNKPPLGTMSESSRLKLAITQEVAEEEVQKRLEQDRQMQDQEFQQQQDQTDSQQQKSGDENQAADGQTAEGGTAEGQEGGGKQQARDENGKPQGKNQAGEGGQRNEGQGNDPSQEQPADPNRQPSEQTDGNNAGEAGGEQQNQKNQTGETGENSRTAEGSGDQGNPSEGATGDAGTKTDSDRPSDNLNADQGQDGDSEQSRPVDDQEAMNKLLEKYRNENGGIDPPSEDIESNQPSEGGTSSEAQMDEDGNPEGGDSESGNEQEPQSDPSGTGQQNGDESSEQTPGKGSQKEPAGDETSEATQPQDGSDSEMAEEDPQRDGQSGQENGEQESGEQGGQKGGSKESGEQGGQKSGSKESGEQGGQKGGGQESGEQGGQKGGSKESGEQGGQKSGGKESGEQGGQKSGGKESGEQGGQKGGSKESGEQGGQKSGGKESGEQGGQKGGGQESGEQGGQKGGGKESGEQGGQKGGGKESGEQGGQKGGGKESGEQGGQKGGGKESGEQGGQKSGGKESGEQGGQKSGGKESGEQGGQKGRGQESGEQGGQKGGGQESGQQGGQQSGGKAGEAQSSGSASGTQGGMGAKGGTSAGPQGDSNQTGVGGASESEFQSDDPDVQSSAEAADLVLKRLQQDLQRGEVDEDLLKELGWTQDQLKQFNARMRKKLDTLKDTEAPSSKAEHLRRRRAEELLKSLDLKGDSSERMGRNDNEIEQQDTTSRRSTPPAKYKDWMELFQRGLSKGKPGPRE